MQSLLKEVGRPPRASLVPDWPNAVAGQIEGGILPILSQYATLCVTFVPELGLFRRVFVSVHTLWTF